jgi:pilus assembly protein CpaD
MIDCPAASERRRNAVHLLRAGLLAGCAALLSGCMTHSGPVALATAPNDFRQRHPITIKEKDHTVELFIGNRRGSLTPMQRAEALAFARSWSREATAGIVIETPTGSPNAAAAASAVREVQSLFVAAGIPASSVAVRNYPARRGHLATVRLNYPRMAGEAGPCGLWPEDVGATADSYRWNKPYWNFGCATQHNLAAMVAHPADLAQPRGEDEVYRQRRTTVLEKYRQGAQTGSTAPSNDAAKISDVGK